MTAVVMAMLCIVAVWVQVALGPFTWLGSAKWPVLMALVLYYALHRPTVVALIAALVCGVLQDASSDVLPLGLSSLLFCGAVVLVARIRRVVIPEAALTALTFGSIGGAAMTLVQFVVLRASGTIGTGLGMALLHVLGCALLGAVACVIVFPLCRGIESFAGNLESKEDVDGFEWSA